MYAVSGIFLVSNGDCNENAGEREHLRTLVAVTGHRGVTATKCVALCLCIWNIFTCTHQHKRLHMHNVSLMGVADGWVP